MKQISHRYQRGHWDAVILDYREFALDASYAPAASLNEIMDPIIRGLNVRHATHDSSIMSGDDAVTDWLPPHVIDLKAQGEIRPHVDSVRFSGDLVCGLSLLSTAIMRLRPSYDENDEKTEAGDSHSHDTTSPDLEPAAGEHPSGYIDVLLPPRSLYVLQGHGRYHMTHALRPSGSMFAPLNEVVKRERRLSIILRDAKRNTANLDK